MTDVQVRDDAQQRLDADLRHRLALERAADDLERRGQHGTGLRRRRDPLELGDARKLLRRRARLVRRRERGAEASKAEAIAPSVADDDVRLVWVEMVVVARELEREEHVWFGKVVLNPRPPF